MTLFSIGAVDWSEFSEDIQHILTDRTWCEITLHDWTMLPSINVIKRYMTPEAFHYYLPSLLYTTYMNSIGNSDHYLNYAMDALLPDNAQKVAKGVWWQDYYAYFTSEQRSFIKLFFKKVLHKLPANGDENMAIEKFWLNL